MMFKRLKSYLPRWYVEYWQKEIPRSSDNYTYRKGIQVADPEIEDMIQDYSKLRARIIAERNKK